MKSQQWVKSTKNGCSFHRSKIHSRLRTLTPFELKFATPANMGLISFLGWLWPLLAWLPIQLENRLNPQLKLSQKMWLVTYDKHICSDKHYWLGHFLLLGLVQLCTCTCNLCTHYKYMLVLSIQSSVSLRSSSFPHHPIYPQNTPTKLM